MAPRGSSSPDGDVTPSHMQRDASDVTALSGQPHTMSS